jgi:hypothetical protein
VLGTGVLLGMGEAVKGKAVSVSGRVGWGVTVFPGNGVGLGVRVATLGTQRISPERIKSLVRQFTLFNKSGLE